MKQLTDSERLEVAMSLLTDEQVDEYANRCAELERDCKHNGFYNVPAECEMFECRNCIMRDEERRITGCPYVN